MSYLAQHRLISKEIGSTETSRFPLHFVTDEFKMYFASYDFHRYFCFEDQFNAQPVSAATFTETYDNSRIFTQLKKNEFVDIIEYYQFVLLRFITDKHSSFDYKEIRETRFGDLFYVKITIEERNKYFVLEGKQTHVPFFEMIKNQVKFMGFRLEDYNGKTARTEQDFAISCVYYKEYFIGCLLWKL